MSQKQEVIGLVFSDQEALSASLNFLDDHRVLVEPTCGATYPFLYNKKFYQLEAKNRSIIIYERSFLRLLKAIKNL